MSLHEIHKKEPTVATPSVYNLVAAPDMWDRKFRFHVSTHISIGNLGNRWDAIINNLLKKRSVTGLIYADKGYGKTSTGISLWEAAEAKQIVTVPPFVWGSLADMLTATHAWVCYRLQDTRPELIPDIEQKHREIVEVDEETLAQMYCTPKFGPLPKPRLWYNIHDLKGGPNGETKTQKLHP